MKAPKEKNPCSLQGTKLSGQNTDMGRNSGEFLFEEDTQGEGRFV